MVARIPSFRMEWAEPWRAGLRFVSAAGMNARMPRTRMPEARIPRRPAARFDPAPMPDARIPRRPAARFDPAPIPDARIPRRPAARFDPAPMPEARIPCRPAARFPFRPWQNVRRTPSARLPEVSAAVPPFAASTLRNERAALWNWYAADPFMVVKYIACAGRSEPSSHEGLPDVPLAVCTPGRLNPHVRRQELPVLLQAFFVFECVILGLAGTLALMRLGVGSFLESEKMAPGILAVAFIGAFGTISYFSWQLHPWAVWLAVRP